MSKRARANPSFEDVANPEDYAEKLTQDHGASPEDYALASGEPPHNTSLTEIAAEAMRTGVFPDARDEKIPGQDDVLRAGDPDSDPLENLYSGEELPTGSAPTPDQGGVDDIGRLSGLSDEDTGTLRTADELLDRRDARRWDQEALATGK
jgi:hypothetical protein